MITHRSTAVCAEREVEPVSTRVRRMPIYRNRTEQHLWWRTSITTAEARTMRLVRRTGRSPYRREQRPQYVLAGTEPESSPLRSRLSPLLAAAFPSLSTPPYDYTSSSLYKTIHDYPRRYRCNTTRYVQ